MTAAGGFALGATFPPLGLSLIIVGELLPDCAEDPGERAADAVASHGP